MKQRRFLALAVACALAVLGVILILGYIRHVENKPIPNGAQAFTATQPIPGGTPVRTAIDKHWAKRVLYPKSTLPAGYILWPSHEQIDGGEVFTSDIAAGQIILGIMIGSKDQEAPLVPPPGDGLVGLSVCQTEAIGGYVKPGMKIDVINLYATEPAHALTATCRPQPPPPGGWKEKLIQSNALVMAVDSQLPAEQSPTDASPPPAGTPPGCEAATQGQICIEVAVPDADVTKLSGYAVTGDLLIGDANGGRIPPSASGP